MSFYIKNIPDYIYICLYSYQREDLPDQDIHDFKGIALISEADTVVEILEFLLQQPDHCDVIPSAKVVLDPFLCVIDPFVAVGLVKLYGNHPMWEIQLYGYSDDHLIVYSVFLSSFIQIIQGGSPWYLPHKGI